MVWFQHVKDNGWFHIEDVKWVGFRLYDIFPEGIVWQHFNSCECRSLLYSTSYESSWQRVITGSHVCQYVTRNNDGSVHYSDVMMSTMASQITSLTSVYSAVYSGADQRKTTKLCVTGLCEVNSPVTGECPTQTASNPKNVMTSSYHAYVHHRASITYRNWYQYWGHCCLIKDLRSSSQPEAEA